MKTLVVNNLNVKYVYGALAISNLSFVAEEGKIITVLGDSEAGKTSLLKALAGLETHISGEIILNGADLAKAPLKTRNVCYVSAYGTFFERRTVKYNLRYPLLIRKTSKADADLKISEVCEKLNVNKEILDCKIKKLSNSDRVKVAFARALLRDADLYLIDNPLKCLTDAEREADFDFYLEIMKNLSGKSILIYATDSGCECVKSAGEIIYLSYGICMQRGDAESLIKYPQSLQTFKKFHEGVEAKEATIIRNEGNGEICLEADGETVVLDKDKLMDEIFIGRPVILGRDINGTKKIFDAASERLIYFD